MKRPTGPGRIRVAAASRLAPVQGLSALLYNFDFDDAAVKPEHQAWLRENAVPILKHATSKRVFLRGTASRIGDRNYNLDLSRRRVEAVRNFLSGQGVPAAQIITTFTGEDRSASSLPDDERDRAVEAIIDVSGTPRFVRAMPGGANDGFDDGSDPATAVVSNESPVFLRLLGGAGAVVESLNPGVVRVVDPFQPGLQRVVATSDNFLLRLQPGVPGQAPVVAHFMPAASKAQDADPVVKMIPGLGGAVDAILVATLPKKVVSVAFHYVQGPKEPAGVATTRTQDRSNEDKLLAEMNRIFTPQTHIEFSWKSSQIVSSNGCKFSDVDIDGGRIDGGRTDPQKIFSTPRADKTARVQFYFVGKIGTATGDIGAVTIPQGGKEILCQDGLEFKQGAFVALTTDVAKVGHVLAHEAGHACNEPDNKSDRTLLMFEKAVGGERIPVAAAVQMNSFLP